MRQILWLNGIICCVAAGVAGGQVSPESAPALGDFLVPTEPVPSLRADLRLDRAILQSGHPVWAELSLTNMTDKPITLQVPDAPSKEPSGVGEVGLPLAHVFSGKDFGAISIRDSRGDLLEDRTFHKPSDPIPVVHLAAHSSIGIRVDLAQHYISLLRRPGKYTLMWKPYGGMVESEPVTVSLLAEQQAVILTDYGRLVMRFYYDQAPRHVQNFIELVNQRFYDNLTFHRVVRGAIVQGGDPQGTGKGTRPDGKRVPAEFNRVPFEVGTVGMARSPKDPDSASCQFFICLSRRAEFDGDQTAFAYLVGQESFDTLNKIGSAPTNAKDRPVKPVFIRAVSLEEVPMRDSATPNVMISSASRPSMVQRDLEPARVMQETQAGPRQAELTPAQRLSRTSRLASTTQPGALR